MDDSFTAPIIRFIWHEWQDIHFRIISIIAIAASVALGFLLWHIKGRRNKAGISVTQDNIAEVKEKITEILASLKATPREITHALLLLEEISVRLHANAQTAVTVRVKHLFGDIDLQITSHGEGYNPFASLESWDTESEEYLRDLVFRAYEDDLSYNRKNGRNIVTVSVRSAERNSNYATFIAMLAGIAAGFCMKFIPATVASFISDDVLALAQTLFLNAISLMLAPIVFFSISTSLSRLSGGSEIGRIGGKVLGTFLVTTVISIVIGFTLARIFFSGDLPPLPKVFTAISDDMKKPKDISVTSMVLGIIPKDMATPVLEGNMLQIIFCAVLAGLALSTLGEKTDGLRNMFDEANAFFLKIMEMIISFMPVVAFSAMAILVHSCELKTLAVLAMFILASVAGGIIILSLFMLLILFLGRLSPLQYIKKTIVYLLTPFMLSSSSACIPFTIDFCKKKLGISNKIASFSIPLGATINMNGTAMVLVLTVVLLARLCGVNVDAADCLKLGVMAFLLAVGAPGVPNYGLVVISTMLVAIKVPVASIGFVVGIWSIQDRIQTALNVHGDIGTSVIVAKSEGELDKEVYSA